MVHKVLKRAIMAFAISAPIFAQDVRILLPERTRLLQGQQFDLVLEVRNAKAVTGLKVVVAGVDLTSKFSAPKAADLDCDATSDWVMRADLQSIDAIGDVKVDASLTADGKSLTDSRTVQVREFNVANGQKRNIILFIGDAMGTAYRDAGRLVSRAIVDANGRNSFRDGFFDNLQEMDKMPISGMSMTYGTDSIVPDSANTGSNWATGNKTYLNAVNSLTDGTDCKWRFNGQTNAANLQFISDNPRIENLWQYLKRRYNYRTGIVSTAAITDATPAVEGAYTGYRQARLEIARQYLENPMLGGRPAFDLILGGGLDPFTAAGRVDKRDLVGEFQALGYRYVTNATDLRNISYGQPTLGLFKGSASPAPASNGIATATDANMEVAYDKLKLQRPASEPLPNFGTYTDQPMLDLMTQKAIEVLSSSFSSAPFILMVEAASIDKQSHPNQAAGTIWDVIEFDKAIGVARTWASKRTVKDTLVIVTADHDQSMSIIGVSNTPDASYFDRTNLVKVNIKTPAGDQDFTYFGDAFSNARAAIPFINTSTTASNNGGLAGMGGPMAPVVSDVAPETSTYSTYFGSTAYKLDDKTGYPVNSGVGIRRLAVGYRTGDHTGSSVPVTAEGPGAFLFTGYMDQTDIFFKMAAAISNDTSDADKLVDILTSGKFPKTIGK